MKGFCALSLLLAGAWACGGEPDGTQPPPRTNRPDCTPASAGITTSTPVPIPGITLPAECKILEDDGQVAVHRRQVTVLRSEADLQRECRLAEPGPISGLLDFQTQRLLLVRIPNISAPRWAAEANGTVTIGESTTECSGIDVMPLRYVVVVPATSTVTFHLCAPTGCDEDPAG